MVFQIGADRYSMRSGLTSQHPGHFADDLIDRDQLSFGRGLLVQRSQTVDDFRGKGAGFDDFFRPFANFRQIGRVALKPSQRCLGISGCDRKGLSDPEAVRFRYKLQEADKDWHEAEAAPHVSRLPKTSPLTRFAESFTAYATSALRIWKVSEIASSTQP